MISNCLGTGTIYHMRGKNRAMRNGMTTALESISDFFFVLLSWDIVNLTF